MRRFSMIVIVLAAVAIGSVYGQAAWRLRVGVVAGKRPLRWKLCLVQGVAYTIINVSDGKPMPHMSDLTPTALRDQPIEPHRSGTLHKQVE